MTSRSGASIRARAALREGLPQGLLDERGYVEQFDQNLLETLDVAQRQQVREQLSSGDGNELRVRVGKPPSAHAVHSSAALVANAFGYWFGREGRLTIADRSGFDEVRLERQLRIFKGGRAPNLDVVATGPGVSVAIESKLTETLSRKTASEWSDAYRRPECREGVGEGWVATLDAAMSGTYRTAWLDVPQLLKHALGTQRRLGQSPVLIYLYWEPKNAAEFNTVVAHRAELAEFAERVSGGSPGFVSVTHDELWREWEVTAPEHVAALRDRYDVSI